MIVEGAFSPYTVDDRPFTSGGHSHLFASSAPAGVIYKRYRSPIRDAHRRWQLLRIRQLGREVLIHRSQEPGSTPEASINWPIDSVQDSHGAILGVVIPRVPGSFFLPGDSPRALDFLLLARAQPPPPPARVRVAVLIRIAEIFAWLHRNELVHGDFSSKNVVWRSEPEPGAYLIDCDWLQPQRPPPHHGTATRGWFDPRLDEGFIQAPDHYSDWYALALAMYRGLLLNPGWLERDADGRWPKPAGIPTTLHPQLRALLTQTLNHPTDAKARASPSQWISALLASFVGPAGFDANALGALDAYADRFRMKYAMRPDMSESVRRRSARPRPPLTTPAKRPTARPPVAPGHPPPPQQPPAASGSPSARPGLRHRLTKRLKDNSGPVVFSGALLGLVILLLVVASNFGNQSEDPAVDPPPSFVSSQPSPSAHPDVSTSTPEPRAQEPSDDSPSFSSPPRFSRGPLGTSRDDSFLSDGEARITRVSRAGFVLRVYFDAQDDDGELDPPRWSCIQVPHPSDPSASPLVLTPIALRLTQRQPGRLVGRVDFPLILPGTYSFQYDCDSYTSVKLGRAGRLSYVGISEYSTSWYVAVVFRVSQTPRQGQPEGKFVLEFAAAGLKDLNPPRTSCLIQNDYERIYPSEVNTQMRSRWQGALVVGTMTFRGTTPGRFSYACYYSSIDIGLGPVDQQ